MVGVSVSNHPSVNQEDLCMAVIGSLNGGTAFNNRAYFELHTIDIGFGFQLAALAQLAIHLIAVLLGIAVLGIEADGRRGDIELLTVGGDSDLWHFGSHAGIAGLTKADITRLAEERVSRFLMEQERIL